MAGDMLILQRGYAGELLNAFTTRGRRTPEPGGLRSATYLKYLRTPGSFSLQFNAHDRRILSLRPYHLIEFWLRDGYNDLAYQQFQASLPAYAKDARMPGWYRDFTGFVLTEPRLASHFVRIGFDIRAVGRTIEHRGERVPSLLQARQRIRTWDEIPS